MRQEKTFSKGLKDGIPICLGYLSVSFTFGMMAAKGGLPLWAIQLISMTNLTSAGQFTGNDADFIRWGVSGDCGNHFRD